MIMLFILGFIIGLIVACLIVATLTFFRRVIEHRVNIIEKQIDIKGPRPKGYIIEPQSDAEEVREKIIEKNRMEGKDTPIKDLL